mmetsp:Transcript_13958/g.39159  ORF Transcript_13958/g.39159 Transcript_13958/m.39159 type:complete len:452 (+) Transcript_13958:366-1721(+)
MTATNAEGSIGTKQLLTEEEDVHEHEHEHEHDKHEHEHEYEKHEHEHENENEHEHEHEQEDEHEHEHEHENEHKHEHHPSRTEIVLNATAAAIALAFSRAAPVAVSPSMAFNTLDADNLCRVPTDDTMSYNYSQEYHPLLDDESTIVTWESILSVRNIDGDVISVEEVRSLLLENEDEEDENIRMQEEPIGEVRQEGNGLVITPGIKGQIEISLHDDAAPKVEEEEKKKESQHTSPRRKPRFWNPTLKKKILAILKVSSKNKSRPEAKKGSDTTVVEREEASYKKELRQHVLYKYYVNEDSDELTDDGSYEEISDLSTVSSGSAEYSSVIPSESSSTSASLTSKELGEKQSVVRGQTSKNLAGFEMERFTSQLVGITPNVLPALFEKSSDGAGESPLMRIRTFQRSLIYGSQPILPSTEEEEHQGETGTEIELTASPVPSRESAAFSTANV